MVNIEVTATDTIAINGIRGASDGAADLLPSPVISNTLGEGGMMHALVTSIHGKGHRIVFDKFKNVFEFYLIEDEKVRIVYRVDELLAVRNAPLKIRKGKLRPIEQKGSPSESTLYFFFVFRKNKHKWRVLQLPIVFSTSTERDYWQNNINVVLNKLEQRPRKIIVYINPFGGKGKAPKIYKQYVEPLFQLASINVEVVYTQYANHAKEHVETMDENEWNTVDGVVSVGGDGLFNECLAGAINRTQAERSIDVDDRRSLLHSPRVRFGIIGAGSANSIVMTVHDTDDYATSAVHIAIGSRCRVDACTVHESSKLLRVSADAISYGWLGDVLRDSERYRWLGPLRYQLSALRTTIRNPTYRGCVSFSLTAGTDQANPEEKLPPCVQPCPKCNASQGIPSESGESSPPTAGEYNFHWHTDFSHVICCVIPCVTPFTPLGLAPFTSLGDGSMDLAMLPQLGCCANISFLKKAAQLGGRRLYEQEPWLNCYRVAAWSFRPDPNLEDMGVWNVDGEIVTQPAEALHFRLQPQLIRFFGRDAAVIEPSKRSILRKRKSSIVYR